MHREFKRGRSSFPFGVEIGVVEVGASIKVLAGTIAPVPDPIPWRYSADPIRPAEVPASGGGDRGGVARVRV